MTQQRSEILFLALAILASGCEVSGSESEDFEGSSTREHGMRLVDFDEEVARAHGFEIVELPDGSRASVPAEKADAARAGIYWPTEGVLRSNDDEHGLLRGYDYKPGECGVSYVGLNAIGSSLAVLETGYDIEVDADVWAMNWNVRINDNGGSSNQHYESSDGGPGVFTWESEIRLLGLTRGPASATVEWYTSWALLTNGWLCYSLGPSAGTTIY